MSCPFLIIFSSLPAKKKRLSFTLFSPPPSFPLFLGEERHSKINKINKINSFFLICYLKRHLFIFVLSLRELWYYRKKDIGTSRVEKYWLQQSFPSFQYWNVLVRVGWVGLVWNQSIQGRLERDRPPFCWKIFIATKSLWGEGETKCHQMNK